jgi:hypothetical protein
MKLLYNTTTQELCAYPRSDDEAVTGLAAEYLTMTVTRDDAPELDDPLTQRLVGTETIDADACTVHYGWQIEALPPTVKVWPSKAEFWAEFTTQEKAGIITNANLGIRMLDKELTMWTASVRADDQRIIDGLSGLVSAGIISEERKAQIL